MIMSPYAGLRNIFTPSFLPGVLGTTVKAGEANLTSLHLPIPGL